MIKIDWNPPPKILRLFSVSTAAFAGLVGAWLRFGHGASWTVAGIVWGLGAAILVGGLLVPPLVRPVYVVMNAIFMPVGIVVSFVILSLVYYGAFTPIGLLLRLFGHDPMGKRFLPEADTYWTERTPPDSVKRYFRQY